MKQLNLFGESEKQAEPRRRNRKAQKPDGYQNMREASERVTANADAKNPGWRKAAKWHVIDFARRHPGQKFMAEDIINDAESKGFAKPHDGRAWGSIIARCGSEKNAARVLEKAGFGKSKNPKHNHGTKTVWRSLF